MSKEKLPRKDKLLHMYKKMYEIRHFEEKLYQLFLTQPMPGTMHQSTGQEATAVGVCENLREDDYVISTHRGHGHFIAKEGPLNTVMAEMFAKKTGCCRGMGGSMHLTDISVGILGSTAIVGAAIGAAITGMRPVAEIQFNDFLACAMDQVVNQAAKMRLMSGGQIKVPLVIRSPVGATGRAAQHSQSLEAWFMHVPGLKVVLPSTPYDAKGLLKTAIRGDNPVMVFEHKLLYGSESPGGKAKMAVIMKYPALKGEVSQNSSSCSA